MIYRNLCKLEVGELLIENLECDFYDVDSCFLCVDVDNLVIYIEKELNYFILSISKGGYLDRNVLWDWLCWLWIFRFDFCLCFWKVCMFDKLLKKYFYGLFYVFNYK